MSTEYTCSPPPPIPLAQHLLQRLRRAHLPLPERPVEHLRENHHAVGVLHGKPDLGVLAAPLAGHADRLPKHIPADSLAAVPQPGGPRADHSLAALEAVLPAVRLPPAAAAGAAVCVLRRGPLEPEDQGADDVLAVSGAEDQVLGRAGAGADEVPREALGGAQVARGREADADEVRHDGAAGEHEGRAQVVLGVADPRVAVDGGEDNGEDGHQQRVEDEVESGSLALLGDAVGHEVEGRGFVGALGQDLEREGRDVAVKDGLWRGH